VYTEPGEPPRVRPPLTKRLTRRHWILLDCLAAVVAAAIIAASVWAQYHSASARHSATTALLGVLLALAGGIPVALRRVRPLVALGTLLAVSVVLSVIGASYGPIVELPAAYVLYMVAATSRRKVAAIALACALATVVVEAYRIGVLGNGGVGSAVSLGLILIIFWGFGSAVRQRRAYANGLQQQAASRAVAEERLRIARELHDVVAHSMSVIAVQAGFGQYVIDDQPGKAREALGAIQATSRDALDEMRRMLSVLRQADTAGDGPAAGLYPGDQPDRLADLAADGPARTTDPASPARPARWLGGPLRPASPGEPTGLAGRPAPAGSGYGRFQDHTAAQTAASAARRAAAPLWPAPGLADLDRLITRVGHAGVHVDLRVNGERRDVPAGVDLSAFRIIQEALTNVVKHAATPDCRVTIDYRDGELGLEIIDEGHAAVLAPAGPGTTPVVSGHGLIGMRERVHLCGGQFGAGPRPERGFRVAATLPLSRAGS
jgi:signal transduction histidine kinase